ncbi:MAG TPA: ankyrin repeat domain-containing protein [Hyphomicrobiales bacterium]|nr:ankyrin repeat domain-containing protein [Hyphomicrobiales bacterium]
MRGFLTRRLPTAMPRSSGSAQRPSSLRVLLLSSLLFSAAPLLAQPLDPLEDGRGLALLDAVKANDTITARQLLDGARNVDQPEADGMTALHYAVLNASEELVAALLQAGADASAATRYGVSPLYLAVQNGDAAITKRLLDAGADPNQEYREGERMLMTAARTGDAATVELLLNAGAQVDARENWHGQTALMWAMAQQHPALVKILVSHGADVNANSNIEEWERQITEEPREKWLPPGGMTPLHFAAREGCTACIAPLLQHGADIDAATPKGLTALLLAIINGHYDTAWQLVEAGANVNLNDDTNRSPLYAAVDFNSMPESNRPSPDVFVNEHDSLALIELLLKHGADVNVQLSQMAPYRLKLDRGNDTMLGAGTTPFLRAAKSADLPTMELLLRHGADATLTTSAGIDPLMAAANLGTHESDSTGRYKTEAQIIAAIELCQRQGLNVDARTRDGRNALFGAATFGFTEVVRYLAEQGAEVHYQDSRGLSPLDAAMGKAGGFGFSGSDGVFWKETVALLESL